uniref:MULE transposase domain-containing protein n=2 Tax=Rhizophagus irregularis (strain DAOM 181602 / DAOM 197198 / MUCL 43194) TaxID=747089 RepID=U9SZL2_RHIID
MSQEYHPYMPSTIALRARIKRVRRSEMPPQPQTLGEINIPDFLSRTLNGDSFLVKDFMFGEDRILLFTTKANIQHLSQAPFLMMNGTFDTVPVIFCQLYSIHAPVGRENSRILPLVYSLTTKLIDFAAENSIDLQPSVVITDFKQASINALRHVFPNIRNKGCFFHLGQSGWRKIQSCGLATRYGNDEHFSLMLRHLFALAFLPSNEIPEAFINTLKLEMPPEADEVVKWFEENYVYGKIRRHLRNGNTIRGAPLFPPELWSVHDSIETGIPRTQNIVEAWHRRWNILVGKAMLVFIR